ncbi:MAG: anthranilate phosphoribosyltransferase [Thermoplasmata archaeon]
MNAGLLDRLLDPRPLGAREVRAAFDALTAPATAEDERAALLVALRARGHPALELLAFAREMRRRAIPFPVPRRDRALDLCGSGGALHPSFNVSTVSAFVARAAGRAVVKHGNRSRRVCGSSDLLDALGLPVLTSIPFARASYRRFGIAFLHAPLFHPATRAVAATRLRLGIPTIFNRLGPLSNPARVRCQVAGAPDLPSAIETARILPVLGVERGAAMASDDGCDEFSPRASTTAIVWTGARTRRLRVDPTPLLPADDRRGPWGPLPPPEAAEEAERILAGGGGARRGSVLLTSGTALWVGGDVPALADGIERAREALDSGAAERLLENLRGLAARFPTSPKES